MTVCLNMIVKNESGVIRRCLESVKGWIDYWVIVDTGSTDGTQTIIKEYLADIPGELYERPWVDFGHNRNEALDWARNRADYLLLIDADDQMVFSSDFKWPKLEKDYYIVIQKDAACGVETKWMFLISTRLRWRWEGALHEALICPEAKSFDLLSGATNLYIQDGARSRDPQKTEKDIQILLSAIERDPSDSKSLFYLAETYRGIQAYGLAIEAYKKRVDLKGWPEEVFWCLYCIGRLERELGLEFVESCWKAYRHRPSRIEPLYDLTDYYMKTGDFESAYQIAKITSTTPLPITDSMFVSRSIYDWGALLHLAICSSHLGKSDECSDAIAKLLVKPDLPEDLRRQLGERYE